MPRHAKEHGDGINAGFGLVQGQQQRPDPVGHYYGQLEGSTGGFGNVTRIRCTMETCRPSGTRPASAKDPR